MDEQEERIREEYNNRNKWTFVHSFLKNMVLNLITTSNYVKHTINQPIIRSTEDITSSGLKEVYRCFKKSYNDWLVFIKEKSNTGHKDELQKSIKGMIDIVFTICEKDWVYEHLARHLYENIGISYAMNVLKIDYATIDKMKQMQVKIDDHIDSVVFSGEHEYERGTI